MRRSIAVFIMLIVVLVAIHQYAITHGSSFSATPSAQGATPGLTASASPSSTLTPIATPDPAFVQRVIQLTNQDRLAHGCPALIMNPILMGTAQSHSQDMALHDFVGHDSSDGTKAWDRIAAAGYQYAIVAENVAWGQHTPEEVVDAWFNEVPPDDLHRQNILNCKLHDIGVGYFYLANDPGKITAHTYWTQDFGTLGGA